MSQETVRAITVLLVFAGYFTGATITSGLFKRFVGNTDAGIFWGWPLVVLLAPFILFAFLLSKLYELLSGDRS